LIEKATNITQDSNIQDFTNKNKARFLISRKSIHPNHPNQGPNSSLLEVYRQTLQHNLGLGRETLSSNNPKLQ